MSEPPLDPEAIRRCQAATRRLQAVLKASDDIDDGDLSDFFTRKLDELWLEDHFPNIKAKQANRVDGDINDEWEDFLDEADSKPADTDDHEAIKSNDSGWHFECRGLDPVVEGDPGGVIPSMLYPSVDQSNADKLSEAGATAAKGDSNYKGSYSDGQREEPNLRGYSSSDIMLHCFYCNNVGHTAMNCEERKPRAHSSFDIMVDCFYCNKVGHTGVNCEQLRHDISSRNAAAKGLPKMSSKIGNIKERAFSKDLVAEEDSQGMVMNKHLLEDAALEKATLSDCNSSIRQMSPSPENCSQGICNESTDCEALSEKFGDSLEPKDDVKPCGEEMGPMEKGEL